MLGYGALPNARLAFGLMMSHPTEPDDANFASFRAVNDALADENADVASINLARLTDFVELSDFNTLPRYAVPGLDHAHLYSESYNHSSYATLARRALLVILAPPPCPMDASGNGIVDFQDITIILSNWGSAGPFGDVNASGAVNFADLAAILSNWGEVCP